MVRKFLYIIAVLIALVFLGRVALTFWAGDFARIALVPSAAYERPGVLPANAYADPAMWISRPGVKEDPARFRPDGLAADAQSHGAAVFFIHPTSYINRAHWNAPLDDAEANRVARAMVRGMASAFNASPELWAPRYRQATFGAFLTDKADRDSAIDLAYGDVRQAFAAFLAAVPSDRPIVLVGHSQGALHLKRLLRDEVAGKPLAGRIAVAYVVGWPVSLAHDLPAIGLPACARSDQARCVVSWMSFAEPADTREVVGAYALSPALDGKLPGRSPMLCTNPLTWTVGSAAPASANHGTLVPGKAEGTGVLRPGMVPARCGPDNVLLIGPPPEMGDYVLPGNNYHVYDIPLFWADLRANVAVRVAAWKPAG